ncbi:MAG TPA: rod shape-determining protein MreC [Candidatus Anaerotignum merdipullorum]|nr:rod shape-determining protein MreC [Candidatus Anaerotignum merdipullorum]
MFSFFERHKKLILTGAILLLAALALLTSGKKLNATVLDSAIGFVVTPFQDITSGIGSWVENTTSSRREKTELLEENEKLREEVAALQADNQRLALYETENETLSGLLRIAQKYPQYASFGATIIAKNPGVFYDVFTIDSGSMDGIEANMVLVAPEGLVGKVLESGATYAKGQSILDSRSSVPAMSLRTGDLGVVKGDYTLMNNGLCMMEYIDAEAEIAVGDEIVTSHLSDIYPPGLTIGKVREIQSDANGLTKYAVIEPAVDLKHLDTLLVIDKNQTTDAATDPSHSTELPADDSLTESIPLEEEVN